jgi:3-isopropylmalate dehydrogenase
MAASANINPNGTSMFEPVHGSAPKFAGKDVANPFGAILTVQLMLEHLNLDEEARLVSQAVSKAIEQNQVTKDLGGTLGTRAAGNFVCAAIRKQ